MKTRRFAWGCGVLGIVCAQLTAVAAAETDIRDSVVKVYTTQRRPNFTRPWTKLNAREISGTGAIIEGNRIITNAHVVLYASRVMVQAHQSSRRVRARIVAIAPEIDLALLEVKSPSFFEGRKPIPLQESLPKIKQTVNVYGYPVGGEQLSVTEGIISRIEYTSYRYGTRGLRIQVDAALNSGNSGGPAVIDGKIVGVVFSRLRGGDNIGYLIPVEEVRTFLEDIEDGRYDGKPTLYDRMQTAENEALREYLKLPEEFGGMVIKEPFRKDKDYPLKANDVITQIGDHRLDRKGRVTVHGDLQLSFRYLIPKVAREGRVPLTIWRDGKEQVVEVPVLRDYPRVVPYLKNGYPPYFILGPMVFTIGTQDLIAALGSKGMQVMAAMGNPLIRRQFTRPRFEGEQIVVMGVQMFAHPIREGYGHQTIATVTHINGTKIRNLAHLVETVRDAKGEYLVIDLAGSYERLVFRREELLESTEEILEDEDIRSPMSQELLPIWKGASETK